jgi:hypothetical protein
MIPDSDLISEITLISEGIYTIIIFINRILKR